MRASAGFLLGLVMGSVVTSGMAQDARLTGGFREAFTVRDDKGQPTLS